MFSFLFPIHMRSSDAINFSVARVQRWMHLFDGSLRTTVFCRLFEKCLRKNIFNQIIFWNWFMQSLGFLLRCTLSIWHPELNMMKHCKCPKALWQSLWKDETYSVQFWFFHEVFGFFVIQPTFIDNRHPFFLAQITEILPYFQANKRCLGRWPLQNEKWEIRSFFCL